MMICNMMNLLLKIQNRKSITGIIGCFVYIIVSLLIYFSARQCSIKIYIVALVLSIIYFISVCIYYTYFYFYCSNNHCCSDFEQFCLYTLYLVDTSIDSITLFLLCYYKMEFNTVKNQENEELVPPQNE